MRSENKHFNTTQCKFCCIITFFS